jgi:branched-chain amino acid transport system ATP-binding protein
VSTGLTVQRLNVARSGKAVLHDVDLTISPGKITALLGANGAGKSSLVRASCRSQVA